MTLISGLAAYIFTVYAASRLGKKFGVGSFIEFLVPIYNIMLLCDCAGVTRWLTVPLILPWFWDYPLLSLGMGWNALRMLFFAFLMLLNYYWLVCRVLLRALAFVCLVLMWGKIAKRLGKDFLVWGIMTTIFMGIPALVLAFDSSVPAGAGSGRRGGTKYIDI